VQYNDNRNTSDKQNTKYDNISDTSNDLLSKHSRQLIYRTYIWLLINREEGTKIYTV